MKQKALTLSIVIPVYNEEHHIKACLDAIARQSVLPDELIVVDNNSTDNTVQIASQFPFVTVVKESVQGRAAARNKGFNIAKSDIIGRIDADSVVMQGWVERVLKDFEDPTVMGLTGLGKTHLIYGLNSLYSKLWSRAYFWTAHAFFRSMTMWGANMAIRRSIWHKINAETAVDDLIVHEDQDISLLVIGTGGRIQQDNKLVITTAGQSYLYWPKFYNYFKRCLQTKKYHQKRGTYGLPQAQLLSFWQTFPKGLIGWSFTGIFTLYSLICWPFLAFRKSKIQR